MRTVTAQAPATLAGACLAIVQASVGLVIAFGVIVNQGERDAISNLVVALGLALPLAGAAIDHARHISRSAVTSAAIRQGPPLTTAAVVAVTDTKSPAGA